MKKTIALLTSFMTIIAMGAAALSASADSSPLVESDLEEFDYYRLVTSYHKGENGESVPIYEDVYHKFNSIDTGTCSRYGRKYLYAFVTVNNDADTESLFSALGEEVDVVYYYDVADDQHVFKYSSDVDYEALYDIAGVEEVELAKMRYDSTFRVNIVSDESGNQSISSIIITEPGVELTPEMFEDAGLDIISLAKETWQDDLWSVSYPFTGMESYTNFDSVAETIDGIHSCGVNILYAISASPSLVFDTVERAAVEPSTEEPTDTEVPTEEPTDAEVPTEEPTDVEVPTEEPTDVEVPTEEPTDAEVPTEEPTDVEVPTEEPTDTEAPTEDPTGELPQTGMPWARAVQGLAAVLAIGGGALFVESRRKDKNVDENML